MIQTPEPGQRDTRYRILNATAQVILECGIRDGTVAQILLAAQVSRRTFYQHFKSMEDALVVLYEQVTERLVFALGEALRGTRNPALKTENAVNAYLQFEREGGVVLISLQAEAVRSDSMLGPRRQWTLDALTALIDETMVEISGLHIDPLVFRTLMLATESLVIDVQTKGSFTAEDEERLRAVLQPIYLYVLAAAPYLPKREDSA